MTIDRTLLMAAGAGLAVGAGLQLHAIATRDDPHAPITWSAHTRYAPGGAWVFASTLLPGVPPVLKAGLAFASAVTLGGASIMVLHPSNSPNGMLNELEYEQFTSRHVHRLVTHAPIGAVAGALLAAGASIALAGGGVGAARPANPTMVAGLGGIVGAACGALVAALRSSQDSSFIDTGDHDVVELARSFVAHADADGSGRLELGPRSVLARTPPLTPSVAWYMEPYADPSGELRSAGWLAAAADELGDVDGETTVIEATNLFGRFDASADGILQPAEWQGLRAEFFRS